MRTRTKVHFDRLAGIPIALVLNLAARVLGRLMRRDHRVSPDTVRTVVLSKYVGMGSILQATPLIRAVQARFPDARIIFLTSRSCRTLVERLEHVEAIITVDDRNLWRVVVSSLRAIGQLIRARVDLFFDLEVYSAYASTMSLLSFARNRLGFYRESAEHKIGIYTHLMYFNTRCPIRYIYLQLGRTVGCVPVTPDQLGTLRVTVQDRQEAARFNLPSGGYVAVNPNASDLMIERRWPGEQFAELIRQLAANVPVVLIGAPAEREYVSRLAPPGVFNLAGQLSVGGLLALLEDARCLITNDTGPMHMAWALGTPTVCLFGPVDPAHYGWSGAGVEILYRRVYCSPCLHEADEPPCRGNNVCMQRITVAEVHGAVIRVLTTSAPPRATGFTPEFFVDGTAAPLGRVVRGSLQES